MPDETMGHDPTDGSDDAAERDVRWRRVVVELRRDARVRPEAVEAVMAAVLATPTRAPHVHATPGRGSPTRRAPARTPTVRTSPVRALGWLVRPRTITVTPLHAAAAILLVAVAVGAALWRDAGDAGEAARHATAPTRPPLSVSSASAASDESRTVQFVFVSGAAREVSVVGDFNDWQAGSTPLRRVSPDGLWTVDVPLSPGRYTYAFVVDGTRWVPDEAAPRAPDDEFGGETSVVYVRQDT